jgi:hypothetical protein
MKADFQMDRYNNILEMVLKWRALPTPLLREVSGYQGHPRSFNRVLSHLEKSELVCAKRFNGATKLIYPSKDLMDMNPNEKKISEDSITHDGLCAIVVNELLGWRTFFDFKLPHEILGKGYTDGLHRIPDAVLMGRDEKKDFTLALEIELTRKSKLRVKNKLSDYSNNRVFNYVLYIFNDKGTFNSYKNMLNDFIETQVTIESRAEIKARFILAFRENIIHHKYKLDDSEVYYMGKATSLSKIFGIKSNVKLL